MERNRQWGITAGFVLIWAALLIVVLDVAPRSSDLLALWLAAQAFHADELGAIYNSYGDLFTMLPPADWAEWARAAGYEGVVYPYVYPPLWAALVAPLTDLMSFQSFSGAMRVANIALLIATGALAWRIMRPSLPLLLFVAAGQAITLGTVFGALALFENQPQIVVTFLIALALERLRSNSPLAAGVALAFAASIKLYPALFVVLFLAARQYRAAAAFFVAGTGLAAVSVGLAGWPLHEIFLLTLRALSSTALEVGTSLQLDRVLAPVFATEPAIFVPNFLSDGGRGDTGWFAFRKSAVWMAANQIILLGILAGLAVWMRRSVPARQFAAVWPAAIILLSLPAPVAWAYYFCLPVMMTPALVPAMGPRFSIFAGLLLLAPFATFALIALSAVGLATSKVVLFGLPAMVALAVLFGVFGGQPDRPLHPVRSRL